MTNYTEQILIAVPCVVNDLAYLSCVGYSYLCCKFGVRFSFIRSFLRRSFTTTFPNFTTTTHSTFFFFMKTVRICRHLRNLTTVLVPSAKPAFLGIDWLEWRSFFQLRILGKSVHSNEEKKKNFFGATFHNYALIAQNLHFDQPPPPPFLGRTPVKWNFKIYLTPLYNTNSNGRNHYCFRVFSVTVGYSSHQCIRDVSRSHAYL